MIIRKLLTVSVLAASLFVQSNASAAMMAYLALTGQKSGEIKGSVTQKGREGKIGVIAVQHEVRGDASGARKHGALTFTKELDKSTPLLHQLMTNNETLSKFELQFWTPQIRAATGVGSEVQHYTIRLVGARIQSIKFKMDNVRDPALQKFTEYEEVTLTYQSIEWLWTDGGITAADDAKF